MSFLGDFEFYWVREHIIAGSSRPHSEENLQFLVNKMGIKRIISISQPSTIKYYAHDLPVEVIPFEFENFGVPSYNQLQEFFKIIDDSKKKNEPVLIHCAMGCGRTGLLLTAYLMRFEQKDWEKALLELREIRPCAVESSVQLDFLESLKI